MARIERGFRVPPEVPRYFADKGDKPSFSYLDVWGEEHAHAFTVAKATELELRTAIRASLQRAIETGQGFETWRKELVPELARLGWARPRLVADDQPGVPDAARQPAKVVNFAAPGRLQTIFSTNMRVARAVGQWDRIQRTKAALPYLLYVRTTAKEPRPEHLRWAGVILPADDPFWRTHFPPNGWRCRCAVRQVSKGERDRKLGEDGYTDERPALGLKPFRNRRTGEIISVPAGIDPGWGHNPGVARARTLFETAREKLADLPAPERREAAGQILSAGAAARISHALGKADARRRLGDDLRREGAIKAEAARIVDERLPLNREPFPLALFPERLGELLHGRTDTVMATEAVFAKRAGRRELKPEEAAAVATFLDRAEAFAKEGAPNAVVFFGELVPGGRTFFAAIEAKPETDFWLLTTIFEPDRPAEYKANQVEKGWTRVEGRAGGGP